MNLIKFIYNSPFKDLHSHTIYTCFPTIAYNVVRSQFCRTRKAKQSTTKLTPTDSRQICCVEINSQNYLETKFENFDNNKSLLHCRHFLLHQFDYITEASSGDTELISRLNNNTNHWLQKHVHVTCKNGPGDFAQQLRLKSKSGAKYLEWTL